MLLAPGEVFEDNSSVFFRGVVLVVIFGVWFFFIRSSIGTAHALLAHDAIHASFSIKNFLGTGKEGVITTPHINMEFWLGGPGGHHHLSIADHLCVGIPVGMNIRFRHIRIRRWQSGTSRRGEGSALGELRSFASFLEAVLATFLGAGVSAEMAFSFERFTVVC